MCKVICVFKHLTSHTVYLAIKMFGLLNLAEMSIFHLTFQYDKTNKTISIADSLIFIHVHIQSVVRMSSE